MYFSTKVSWITTWRNDKARALGGGRWGGAQRTFPSSQSVSTSLLTWQLSWINFKCLKPVDNACQLIWLNLHKPASRHLITKLTQLACEFTSRQYLTYQNALTLNWKWHLSTDTVTTPRCQLISATFNFTANLPWFMLSFQHFFSVLRCKIPYFEVWDTLKFIELA